MLGSIATFCKKFLIPIGGGISVIGGGVLFIYSQGILAESKRSHKASYESKIDILIAEDSIKTIKIDSLAYYQKIIVSRINKVDRTQGILKTQLGNYIIKTSKDKEDILNWVNAFEEKKNNSSFSIR